MQNVVTTKACDVLSPDVSSRWAKSQVANTVHYWYTITN